MTNAELAEHQNRFDYTRPPLIDSIGGGDPADVGIGTAVAGNCTIAGGDTAHQTLRCGGTLTAAAAQNPRYEAHEPAPPRTALGLGAQFSLIASAALLVTPVVVAQAAGRGDAYLVWMVFASLLVVGVATLIQVRRLGPVGAGAVLPMFTAAFTIPFCITALVDGGPATLTTLIIVTAAAQIIISRWLFILRRIVTPTVGGTVMMILSVTLASVVFDLLDAEAMRDPVAAPLTTLVTLVIVVALTLRASPTLRLWMWRNVF